MISARFLRVLLPLSALTAHALEFERTTSEVTAKPGADAVLTTFPFRNTGKTRVRILGITTSCGCTEAVANPNELAPGQAGAIEVLFTIGQRTGVQQRDLTIEADDAPAPTRLTLKVNIPPASADPAAKR